MHNVVKVKTWNQQVVTKPSHSAHKKPSRYKLSTSDNACKQSRGLMAAMQLALQHR